MVPRSEEKTLKARKNRILEIALVVFLSGGSHLDAQNPVRPQDGADETQKAEGALRQTEILWDSWGVPHIYAEDPPSLFHAFGWAQMASHGDLLLRMYGEARGRASEYWGESHLNADRWLHTMDVPKRAQAWYEAQSPEFRGYLAPPQDKSPGPGRRQFF